MSLGWQHCKGGGVACVAGPLPTADWSCFCTQFAHAACNAVPSCMYDAGKHNFFVNAANNMTAPRQHADQGSSAVSFSAIAEGWQF